MKDGIFYGGLNGSLSCSLKEINKSENTKYWNSTPYDFTTLGEAEVRVSVLNKENNVTTVYVVEIHNIICERPKLICTK